MKPVPKEARTQNVTVKPVKGKPPLCRFCLDDGQVIAEGRTGGYDHAYGPCPMCEAGLRLEFSSPELWPGGFWQGRDLPDSLEPVAVAIPIAAPPSWPVYEPKEMA